MTEDPEITEETPPITEETPPITEETPPITEETPPITEETPAITEETPPAAEETPLREPDLPRTMKVRQKALRTGWTTGSCASAAAKAATLLLRGEDLPGYVEIALPSGNRVTFKVEETVVDNAHDRARAVVVKDAGDDPDVTHGAHITADVSWRDGPGLELDGGEGVGVVTRPGLGLELGGPAINPVPRKMITHAVAEAVFEAPLDETPEAADVTDPASGRGLRVVISVPDGEIMARKTTNKRLGILGGISILGTTGIVRPFSTASWRASVEQAVSVMAAQGETTLVLCTGGRTEKGAMKMLPKLPDVCFVEVGDFTGAALRRAVEHGVKQVVFVGMAGKLTKLAAGVLMTHYTRSKVNTELLGVITTDMGGSAELAAEVAQANTARHAYELWEAAGILGPCGRELCRRVAGVLERFAVEEAGGEVAAQVVLVDFTGERMVGMYGRMAR
ncbi:cobalt-precorrin-5B (C(1))-methyltransferase [Actinomadura sp. 6N118]|uniref:cobalt-precorrin-5B (C(1))-methyltransferase n=1 Tax=Actinomadura sp. 6N118 TaxID=3375151 RepID=UPI00379EE0F7